MRKFFMMLATIAAPGLAGAATLQIDGSGQLIGATGVDVDGVRYDVTFTDGRCADLFDDCDEASDFPFASIEGRDSEPPRDATIRLALEALSSQVFLDTVDGDFDSDPALTAGCESSFCNIVVPYRRALRSDGRLAREVRTLRFVNQVPGSTGFDNDDFGFLGFSATLDLVELDSSTFAVFTRGEPGPLTPETPEAPGTPGTNVIPLPAAGWMLLAGLGAIGLMRRRADPARVG